MNKNKFRFALFFVIVLVIIIGGFILMKKSENYGSTPRKKSSDDNIQEIRLDDTKDYIYFEDTDTIVEALGLEYKTIKLNFNGNDELVRTLNDETASLKETVKYDDTIEDDTYNKLSSARYKTHSVVMVSKYISLIINYYHFDPTALAVYESTKTYVFDKQTGNLISNNELLTDFSLTEEDLKNKVKAYVDDQNVVRKDENLDSRATVASLGADYALYVDKMGKLTISVLVKSDQKDYNDTITLN